MTANEEKLINIIHNDYNPEEAFKIALDLLLERLNELEALQGTCPAPQPEAI